MGHHNELKDIMGYWQSVAHYPVETRKKIAIEALLKTVLRCREKPMKIKTKLGEVEIPRQCLITAMDERGGDTVYLAQDTTPMGRGYEVDRYEFDRINRINSTESRCCYECQFYNSFGHCNLDNKQITYDSKICEDFKESQ